MAGFVAPIIEGLAIYKEHQQKQKAAFHSELVADQLKNRIIAMAVKQTVDLARAYHGISKHSK